MSEYLSDELEKLLEQAAAEIGKSRTLEETYYAALDYLESKLTEESVRQDLLPSGHLISILRLYTSSTGPTINGNFARAIPIGGQVDVGPDIEFVDWSTEEQNAFPKSGLALDEKYMLIRINTGSTTICYFTPDGRKKCYTRD